MKKTFAVIALLAVFAAIQVVAPVFAADFIGAKKCKMCHKEQFAKWEGSSHAKAHKVLPEESAKDKACLKCHSVGKDDGVGCEACHGAGSEYKAMKVMKDPEAAKAAGLADAKAACAKCHAGKRPDGHAESKGVTYDSHFKKIAHPKK